MTPKILIIKLSAIGDVVHVLPALHALRTQFPDGQIDWLVEEPSSPLLQNHPLLNNLYIFRKKWKKSVLRHFVSDIIPFFKKIRSQKYDWAVDFQGLTKSGVGAYFSGARRVIGYGDRDGREFNKLFTNVKVRPSAGLHVVERNLALLGPLGIENPPVRFPLPDFPLPQDPYPGQEFIIVNPGAGWQTKRLPLETLADLCALVDREQGLRSMISWGPGEEDMAEDLCRKIEAKGGRAGVAPPTNLLELSGLMSRARLFIGGDTGPTHIAAALGIPVLSFFGASDARRNSPYGKHCISLQKFDIPCVPCWKTACRFKGSRFLTCLSTIKAEELYQKAKDLISMTMK